jgi:hypothetical protein
MITKEMWEGVLEDSTETSEYFLLCSKNYSGVGEKHHILPKSIWPEYEFCDWNISRLSYRDHYKAHEILTKICLRRREREKMIKSWWIITNRFKCEFIDAEKYSELRELARKSISESMKGNLNNLGNRRSDETKRKLSESKVGEKNPMFGKTGDRHHLYGSKISEELKAKLADVARGNTYRRGSTHTEEARRKISEAGKGNKRWLGKKHTEDSIKLIRDRKSKYKYLQYSTVGDLIKVFEYPSSFEGSPFTYNGVRQAARTDKPARHMGFIWKREIRQKESDE